MNIASLLPSTGNNKLSIGPENANADPAEGFEFASLLAGQINGAALSDAAAGTLENTTTSASTATLLGALLAGQTIQAREDKVASLHLPLPDETLSTKTNSLLQADDTANTKLTPARPDDTANTKLNTLLQADENPLVAALTVTNALATRAAPLQPRAPGKSDQDGPPVEAERLLASLKSNDRPENIAENTLITDQTEPETTPIPILRPITEAATAPSQNKALTPSGLTTALPEPTRLNLNKVVDIAAGIPIKPVAAEALATQPAEAAKSAGTPEPFQLPQATQGSEARPVQTRSDATHSIATPVHDPRWAQQLGDRMVWMTRGDIQSAQININPAQLGPIQINISLNGDQMTAHFVAAHQEVRQALDDAMPRLREMLSGAGINLGQANVGSQTPQQQGNGASDMGSNTPRSGNEEVILSPNDSASASTRPITQGRGLVDLFA